MDEERRRRSLTDEDVHAVVQGIFAEGHQELKSWIGDGVMSIIKKAVFLFLFAVAVWGFAHGSRP